MFGSIVLEVGIGIILVNILVSIICSAIREGIEAKLKSRAAYLEQGIRELLQDRDAKGLAVDLFKHPLINGLFSGDYQPTSLGKDQPLLPNGNNLPSYIPSKNFALALMDIAARGAETDEISSDPHGPRMSLESVRLNVLNLRNKKIQRVLLMAVDTAQGDIDRLQQNIEDWYNGSMDRISGWYKRSTQWILFWIGITVSIVLNINTITIADYLYHNDDARKIIVAKAEQASKDSAFLTQGYTQARSALDSLQLPIGWSHGWGAFKSVNDEGGNNAWNAVLAPLLGWLLTALAATLGAPFWFDLLNKMMVIRSTVKPTEKSKDEGSEDRQPPPKPVIAATVQQPVAPAAFVESSNVGQAEVVNSVRDEESHLDGCEVEVEKPTADEDLPAAEGGVSTI